MPAQEDFIEQAAPFRAELIAHCYRMLGSVHDAEDLVQETYLRGWRGYQAFEERAALRTWLYRIATTACLRALENRARRVLPAGLGAGSVDPDTELYGNGGSYQWLEPLPDALTPESAFSARQSVRLAIATALQELPARQRAVLILRDVLGFSGEEVAEALETTPKAVYSALQRAHKTIDRQLPVLSQQQTLRSLGDARVSEVVETYVDAWERGDVDAIVSMLAEEAIVAMPPCPSWYRGLDAAREFLAREPLAPNISRRARGARANGQVAVGVVFFGYPDQPETLQVLQLLTLDTNGRIAEITAFVGTELEPFTPDAP